MRMGIIIVCVGMDAACDASIVAEEEASSTVAGRGGCICSRSRYRGCIGGRGIHWSRSHLV